MNTTIVVTSHCVVSTYPKNGRRYAPMSNAGKNIHRSRFDFAHARVKIHSTATKMPPPTALTIGIASSALPWPRTQINISLARKKRYSVRISAGKRIPLSTSPTIAEPSANVKLML